MEGEQTLLNWLISAKSQHRRRVFLADAATGELIPTYLVAIPEWYVDAEIDRIMQRGMTR